MEVGPKEELTARVGLFKASHQEAAFSRECLSIPYQIETVREPLRNQVSCSHIIHKRTFAHGKTETLTTRNSCLKDLLKSSPPTINTTSAKRDPEIIFATLENKLLEIEEKSRLNVVDQNLKKIPKG